MKDVNVETVIGLIDVFGKWEWRERFASIARQFNLSADRLKSAA